MENSLCNKKVQIVPVIRDSSWLDKGNDGKFLFSNAQIELELKREPKTGHYIDPLKGVDDKTKDKIVEAFALDSVKDLSVNKKVDNFWLDKQRKVMLNKNGMYLDLSNPIEFVQYRLLCTYTETFIASSWAEVKNKQTYRFAFKDEDEVIDNAALTEKDRMKAYTKFGAMQTDEHKMHEFLIIYFFTTKKKDTFPSHTWKAGKFIDVIGKIIDEDIKTFIKVVEDTNYKYKALIYNGYDQGILELVDKHKYQVKGSDHPIGTIEETVKYFSDKKNNEEYMELKAKVESKLRAVKV